MRSRLVVYLLLLAVVVLPAKAITLDQLYEYELEVPDQGEPARLHAMKQAMRQVLLRVGGREALADSAAITAALTQVTTYVQQYQYRHRSIEEHLPITGNVAAAETPQQEQNLLWVRFNSQGIDGLLRAAGYPVWGRERPRVLIWLLVEQGTERLVVAANDGGLARQMLQQEAQQRALPIQLPFWDLADQQKISVAELWGGFEERIIAASQRYRAQAVLTGRLVAINDQGWQVWWDLYINGEQMSWSSSGDAAELLLSSGIHGLADRLTQYFGLTTVAGGGRFTIEVSGIESFDGYDRVMDYLHALNGVTRVVLSRVAEDRLELILESDSGPAAIKRLIALGNTLVEPNTLFQESSEVEVGLPHRYQLKR